jgi:hypothetical protein
MYPAVPAVLFDQEERQCVVRLQGMKTPVSLFTPFVKTTYIREERVEKYAAELYKRLAVAVRGSEARAVVEATAEALRNQALHGNERDEPETAKRPVR